MKQTLVLLLYTSSLAVSLWGVSLAAEVAIHPDDCRRAYEKLLKSLSDSHRKPVHRDHPPTPETLRAWHEWDKTHHKQATLQKIDFACAVDEKPVEVAEEI